MNAMRLAVDSEEDSETDQERNNIINGSEYCSAMPISDILSII